MILIPSAFIEVFFEPITIPLIRLWHKTLWFLKWTGYVLLYLMAVAAIMFSGIMIFVLGSSIGKKVGL